MLLQKAVRNERLTLSPGVSARLREAYRRLGYNEVPSFWLMRILNPFSGALQGAARTLTRGRWPGTRLSLSRRLSRQASKRGLRVTFEPDAEQLQRVARGLVKQAREHDGAHVAWNPELVRWRFFLPTGPRHL